MRAGIRQARRSFNKHLEERTRASPSPHDAEMQKGSAQRLTLSSWWSEGDLNPRHADFQSAALPTELPDRIRVRLPPLTRAYIVAGHSALGKNFFSSRSFLSFAQIRSAIRRFFQKKWRFVTSGSAKHAVRGKTLSKTPGQKTARSYHASHRPLSHRKTVT